jgi:hypothetical protein
MAVMSKLSTRPVTALPVTLIPVEPAGQVITRLDPVGDGALWLTTRKFPSLAAVSGGQLYRSADDGAHWNRVLVDDA